MEVYKLANGLRYRNIEIVYRIFSDKKLLTLFINDFFDFIGRDIHVSLNDVLKFELPRDCHEVQELCNIILTFDGVDRITLTMAGRYRFDMRNVKIKHLVWKEWGWMWT